MIQKKVTSNRAGDEEKRMGSVTDGRKMLHTSNNSHTGLPRVIPSA